jgi:hypothetical protein
MFHVFLQFSNFCYVVVIIIIIIIISGLFNDAFSISGYTASNDRINNDKLMRKDKEGSSKSLPFFLTP